jgi:hypothetical protein
MRNICGGRFQPREVSIIELDVEDYVEDEFTLTLNSDHINCKPIRLKPIICNVPVVAIDVSSIKIGETESGVICAVRGVVTWRERNSYLYIRCGPLIFHITEQTSGLLFEQPGFQNFTPSTLWSPMTMRILARLRNTLERWIQNLACEHFENAIILFDGSLTAGTPDNPVKYVERILDVAKEKGNVVLAFSKTTKLRVAGRNITNLMREMQPPSLLDIDCIVSPQFPPHPVHLLGRVYVAKLAPGGFAFRLDIDREIPRESAFEAVGRLIGCDLVEQGYPETLRVAHILSTFTANEIIGIQRFISKRYGLRMAPQISLRKTLFGPFGTFREAS